MINLSAQNLCKSYKKRKVVDNVSLEVKKGEIVGLLGPNGAGKTTTFYMITGIVNLKVEKYFVTIWKLQTIQCIKELIWV